jgi:predicted amidophosphoribosyltransferase
MALQQTSIHYNKVASYPHYYLCNYLPLSTGRDSLSHSLLKFKRAQQPDLNGWIDCSLEMLGAAFIVPGTTIIRALHHDETAVREDKPVALDLLGKALAKRFHGRYRPSLLFKSRLTREIRRLGREEREAELKGIYYMNRFQPDEDGPILIIDDILTTAATIRAIITAIRPHYPAVPLSIFTLAKADYDSRLNRSGPLLGQTYQLPDGMDWVVADEPSIYYSMEQIMACIRADDWAGVF